jgi:hypothetical protein
VSTTFMMYFINSGRANVIIEIELAGSRATAKVASIIGRQKPHSIAGEAISDHAMMSSYGTRTGRILRWVKDAVREAEIKYQQLLVVLGLRGRVGSTTPFVTNCATSILTQGSIN